MYHFTCKARRCTLTEGHFLPVFPCSRNYPYLLPALPKCSCTFHCSLTFFFHCSLVPNLNWPCSWLFPTSRMAWAHLTDSLRSDLSTLETHVLSAIRLYSYEPRVLCVLEFTSEMTRSSARPTREKFVTDTFPFCSNILAWPIRDLQNLYMHRQFACIRRIVKMHCRVKRY